MELVKMERSSGHPLAIDYTANYEKVSERFDYSPWNPSDWGRRAEWVLDSEGDRAPRGSVVEGLEAYNKRVNNQEPKVLESLQRLREPGVLTVVGGQQAGLLTGPLLVIHKAVSIIRTAKEAEQRLGRPVVPVFWIAGEDHDFDEVNHWYSLTPETVVERYRLEHPTGIRTSISRLDIPSWTEALDQLDQWLPSSEFKLAIMERLNTIAGDSTTLSEFFGRMMGWLFGRYGLVLLDSDDPALRKLEAPMMERLLQSHSQVRAALKQGTHEVERLGYPLQAEQNEDSANLFYFDDQGERVLLYARNGGFTDRKGTFYIEESAVLEQVRREPERFSNNVMTRPLMQDYVLPVLASVLGPGEIAYWSLVKENFHQAGYKLPILVPRLSYTLVEGNIRKNMAKYGWSFEDVLDRFEEKRQEWLVGQGLDQVIGLFEETKTRFEELYAPVLELASRQNPGLAKLSETNKQKIMEQIDFLRNKTQDAVESQFTTGLRQLDRIRLSLAPLSKPQERVYNVVAYLNRYGDDWINELIQQPYENDGSHRLAFL